MILLGCRLVLALVLAVAALAKLLDRPGSRDALASFGVPSRWAATLAVALPLAELATGTALLPRPSAWWGALTAFVLLLLFTAAVGRALYYGERPDCRCFGQLRPAPIGVGTLVRNVAHSSSRRTDGPEEA